MALPAEPDLGRVRSVLSADASILDLGSGPGRIANPLAALGHHVVAVDDSPEMLALIVGAEVELGDVRNLHLGRRFDAVLALSHLVNSPARSQRLDLLRTCREHVHDDGVVLVQRYPPYLGAGRAHERGQRSWNTPSRLGCRRGEVRGRRHVHAGSAFVDSAVHSRDRRRRRVGVARSCHRSDSSRERQRRRRLGSPLPPHPWVSGPPTCGRAHVCRVSRSARDRAHSLTSRGVRVYSSSEREGNSDEHQRVRSHLRGDAQLG